ncbi:MAG: NAD-dependent epimerase/dehydratase family protein [Rhizobiales bacterium]|nr:NAD-dependent epimerase/dehydratase family protein [Hyphomicrobiales bacterium]
MTNRSDGVPIDLVTGGSGFIGCHVVAALCKRGVRVRVLDLAPPADLAADVEFVPGSILDPGCLDAAMANVRHVYHLAGLAKLWARDRSDFDRVNAGGTAQVLRAAASRGVARVIHCSTEAILLPARRGADALIDETVRPALADMPGPYTRSKLAAEQSVRTAVQDGLNALIVNPTVPIGPGDRNLTPPAAMLSMFLNGQSPAFLDCVLNLVDVRDVAAGMILAAERGSAGERYILGGDNVALRELLKMLERISGRAMPKRAVPGWLALASATGAEWVADVVTGRTPAATREGVRLALRSGPFDSNKARSELGYAPRPLQDALADAVTWLAATGAGGR